MLADFINKHKTLVPLVLVLVLGLLVALAIISYEKFHLVSTNPPTGGISNIAPSIEFNFNKKLPSQTLDISSTSHVVSSYQISDKTLLLSLNAPTNLSQTYSIEIASIYDSQGSTIKNLTIHFVPQDISFQNLPAFQQKELLKNQQPKNEVSFTGTNNLLNYGITSSQINLIEGYILKFKPSAKNINFNTGNFSETKSNTSSGTAFIIDYGVVIDGVSYNAASTYIGNNIDLQLYNPQTNTLVFSSGSINTSS